MHDGWRLGGWALFYSDHGSAPSIYLRDAVWVEDDGTELAVQGDGVLVTELAQIRYVEFRKGGTDEGGEA
jgi:hypothetical protein